jgi:hypothetical protein
MDALLLTSTAAAYLIATAIFFVYLFRGDAASRLPTTVLLFGFVVHGGA